MKVFYPVLVIATPNGGTWITRLPAGMSLTEMYLRAMLKRQKKSGATSGN